jgi:nitric oxide dioxygenase
MLSQQARPYIEASVPVLREHGVSITSTFYRNMFREHPELTNIFNMGNQANGAQQQSLAAAVFAYAANFDKPDALTPVVNRIVHKHASVGIKPAHYPIVGRHLLGAIQETLGEAATPQLLDAWGEAYGLLADALIDAEKRLYADAGIDPGAMREMRVAEVRQEADLVISFKLVPNDAGVLPDFKAGQYISVAVTFADGKQQLRQYSLSDAPGKGWLRISVKREPAGAETPAGQVSNWLHDNLKEGGIIKTSPPFGDFQPDTEGDAPVVLLSAGVGITPMISTLNRILEKNPARTVIFGHAARNKSHHAHRADLAAAQAAMPNLKVVTFYESPEQDDLSGTDVHAGLMHLPSLPAWSYADTNVYLCGPIGFMRAQWQALIEAGASASRLHREVFGPEMLDHLI